MQSRSALEGERKQITVMFADIQGSTGLIEGMDPEQSVGRLDPVVRSMIDAVHAYEGTVNRVIGDGIMALFGAPLAQEDHAIRACHAALAMQEAVKREAHSAVMIRVGLNSGEVLVRAIHNDLTMDYDANGPTVNLASRMEQLAGPGTIHMTGYTQQLAEGFVQTRLVGPVSVKGLKDSVQVFELTGVRSGRTRWEVRAAHLLSPFVGREYESDVLHQALHRAESGCGQVVLLGGEPGVGKSRLFWEFLHSDKVRNCRTLRAGAISFSKSVPYGPIVDLLRATFGFASRDDLSRETERVCSVFERLDLSPQRSCFLTLMGLPVEDEHWNILDSGQRRVRMAEAVKALFRQETRARPLLVVLEDLQWADAQTESILEALVDDLPNSRLLLLVSHRPDYRPVWRNSPCAVQLQLPALPGEHADRVLDNLLGREPMLSNLKRILIERTAGNPFFLEESVRVLVDSGFLIGERGAFRLARPVENIKVPASVQTVLAVRVDSLPAEAKRLLQSASAIGKVVDLTLMQSLSDLPGATVLEHVQCLESAGFLKKAASASEFRYTFKHALTQEVAYGTLPHTRRRVLHARILETLERLHADSLSEHVDTLAHHASCGEIWEKAVQYLREAGIRAMARSANVEAADYFEKALSALEHLPTTAITMQQASDLHLDARTALLPLAKHDRVLGHLRKAESLAQSLGDKARAARVYSYLTQYLWLTGQPMQALESGKRALALATTINDFGVEIAANCYIGLSHYSLGNYQHVTDILEKNLLSLNGALIYERFGLVGLPSVLSHAWLIASLIETGDFAPAQEHADAALRIVEGPARAFDKIQAYIACGALQLSRGQIEEATARFEHALEICQTANVHLLVPRTLAFLGYAYACAGRVDEGLPNVETAIEELGSLKLSSVRSQLMGWLAEVYMMAGRIDASLRQATNTLEECRERGERGLEATMLRLLGRVHMKRTHNHFERAEQLLRDALAHAEALGMRPLAARCHLDLADILERQGGVDRASEQRLAAEMLFRMMGMDPSTQRAGTEARLVGQR